MSQVPALLPGSPALCEWTLAGGSAQCAPKLWRWRLRWHAHWHSRLQAQQQRRFGTARPRQTPIFILGLWRSGTTLLHERLAALPGLQSPQTWQCFNPSTFVLTGAPSRIARTARRPMDEGLVRSDSAQEDEFALLLQGAPSLYRGFIDPRRFDQLAEEMLGHSTGAAPDGSSPAWTNAWLHFLAGVEAQGGDRQLVLKSPNHSLRWTYIERLFPHAKRIWIARPLEQVWHSNLRMWRSMIETYGLWPCPDGALEAFLARCLSAYAQALSQALAETEANICWVDFEDLFTQPTALLRALSDFTGQQLNADADALLAGIVQRFPAQAPNTRELPLPPALQSHQQALLEIGRAHV